jgi:hypothetical protein
MANPVTIIASREQSSMVSTWTEYLCLERDDAGAFKLFTGQYEALAEREPFFNEETGDYDIPDEIDGQAVVGVDDDYVVGGELSCIDDEQVVSFRSPDDQEVAMWLESSGWSKHVDAVVLSGALEEIKSLAGGAGGGGGKRISIKGGVFRLMVDGKEVTAIDERFLDVVIVNAAPKIGRKFYMKAYDSDAPSAPDCWSADGEKPDATAANPQATNCASCPQNVKGSGQGESRACRYSQHLAVVLANDIEGDVMQLQLPATSIFGREEGENRPLQAYARFLAAQGVSPETLVTRMKFDTKSEAPKLHFRPMRWLSEDEYASSVEQGQSEDAKRAITMTVAQTDKVEEVVEEETAEPIVRKEEKPAQ